MSRVRFSELDKGRPRIKTKTIIRVLTHTHVFSPAALPNVDRVLLHACLAVRESFLNTDEFPMWTHAVCGAVHGSHFVAGLSMTDSSGSSSGRDRHPSRSRRPGTRGKQTQEVPRCSPIHPQKVGALFADRVRVARVVFLLEKLLGKAFSS